MMNPTATTTRPLLAMPGVQTRMSAEEEQVLLKVLREAPTLAMGSQAQAFEEEFTQLMGCADAVAVSSCSAALELAAVLTGLKPGDEVIIPAHTFVASAVPFARTGATLRWADIDPDTRVVSAPSIASLVNDRTKVVVVVHLYGLPADMDAIMSLANQYGLQVVEDCAQAPGARYKGRRVGSIGDFGCFSFHTHKNMTTLGEGGMLAVRDPAHGRSARRLRWMGNWPFEYKRPQYWQPAMNDLVEPVPGCWPFNFCMGEPNCAVGRCMLKRLDAINHQRRRQAQFIRSELKDYPELVFATVPEDREHAYHLLSARYDGQSYGKTRDDLIQILADQYNLKCVVQYWPLYRAELFRQFGFGDADTPQSDLFFDNMISLPWWSDMPQEVLADMAERIREALNGLRQ